MAERIGPFDPDGFAGVVEAALISGASARLDGLLRQVLADHPALDASHLWVIVAETCLKMGRTKQARHWLERLAAEAAPDDIPPAISAATRCGQASLALRLYRRLSATRLPAADQCLGIARDMVGLAERLRLPRGRNRAWAMHRGLSKAAGRLLEVVLPELPSDALRAQAWSCLAQAHRLRGASPEQVQQALAESARYAAKGAARP